MGPTTRHLPWVEAEPDSVWGRAFTRQEREALEREDEEAGRRVAGLLITIFAIGLLLAFGVLLLGV